MFCVAVDDGHGMKTAGKRTPLFPDGSYIAGKRIQSGSSVLFNGRAEKMRFSCPCSGAGG